ncbi:MAG: PAS domain-containing sensor histidine kinase [Bacteroidota bacterium]
MKIQGITYKENDEDLFRELTESLNEIFYCLNSRLEVLYWNKKAEEFTGIPADEIQNRSLYEFFPKIQGEPVEEILLKAIETQTTRSCEQSYTLNGKRYFFETRAHPSSIGLFVYSKDITDHKTELENQRQKNEFLQKVLNDIPVMLIWLNPNNEVIWVNRTWQQVVGYSLEEINRKNIWEILHNDPTDYQYVLDFIHQAPNRWEEFKTTTKGNGIIDTSWIIKSLTDGSKLGIGQDISQHKRQIDKLSLLNQQIDAIINNLPIIMFSTDTNGIYKTIMGMGLKRINLKPDNLIGQSAYRLYGDTHLETDRFQKYSIRKALNHVLNGNTIGGNLLMNERYINIKMVPEKDRSGEITGILGIGIDITEKEEAKKELDSTNQLLEKTLDSLKEVVLVVGADEKRVINLCNKATWDIFGYTPEELKGKSTRILHLNDEKFEQFGEKGQHQIERYGYYHGEYQMIRKDGRIITTEHTITPLDEKKGWQHGVVSVVRDISKRKQYLQQIENYSQRLKQLNSHLQKIQEEERSRIAREIHDEVGQIFSILNLNLTSLKNDLSENVDTLNKEYIISELEAMGSMTNKGIDTTRTFISELRPVVIDHMHLNEALKWLSDDFENRTGIKTSLNDQIGELKIQESKKVHLFRILQEAFTNVRRHSGATALEINLEKTDKELKMQIKDNGKGIGKEEKTQTRSFGLLGIQERVYDMDGSLSIEGATGLGTFITIKVPLSY